MIIIDWNKLPFDLQKEEIKPYYESLKKKNVELICKRIFDIIVSFVMILLLSPILLVLALWIRLDSPGNAIFKQVRVTQYGRSFKILKFRTMISNAERQGPQVTTEGDSRITHVGKKLRDLRLDELPQLFNILKGDMTFVGTRPEVPKYVKSYSPEMLATLLLPAGVTSIASIEFKDENRLMADSADTDDTYVNVVLPQKMKYNLAAIREYSFFNDIKTMFRTVGAVLKKD